MASKNSPAQQLRDKSLGELQDHVVELKRKNFDLKFQHATRQLEDTAALKKNRRELARTLGLIGEKQLEA